jgi:hypothetical protein
MNWARTLLAWIVMHDVLARKAKRSRGVKHLVSQKDIELLEEHFSQGYS